MDNLIINAGERSPQVDFDFAIGHLSLRGESYPEDASAVFGPIFAAVEAFLTQADGPAIQFDFELIYFNSSSAKALMNLFKILDQAGKLGRSITVNWLFAPDDETMKEFGEDFAEDIAHIAFHLVESPAE